jgi:hypothetical protein
VEEEEDEKGQRFWRPLRGLLSPYKSGLIAPQAHVAFAREIKGLGAGLAGPRGRRASMRERRTLTNITRALNRGGGESEGRAGVPREREARAGRFMAHARESTSPLKREWRVVKIRSRVLSGRSHRTSLSSLAGRSAGSARPRGRRRSGDAGAW